MNDHKQSRKTTVDRFLKTLDGPSASADQLRESQDRLRVLMQSELDAHAQDRQAPQSSKRTFHPKLWISIAAAGALALLLVFFTRPGAPRLNTSPINSATIGQTAEGIPIREGEAVRTAPREGTSIVLSDGSRVELGANVELRVDRGSDGIQINLTRGVVIVTAAHQNKGHLRVQTKDCTVSVVGTVFSVRAEPSGSRVSVFEGKVSVTQTGKLKLLLPGEQFTTSSAVAAVPLQKEIAWSVNAPALVSMATLARSPAVQQSSPLSGSSSIEGMVVRQGTNEPIEGAELELSRVEGTAAAPLGPGVADLFNSILYNNNYGLPAQGAAPPPLLAPEVKYGKTGSDGKFAFRDLKEGKYRLVAIRSGGLYYPVEFGQRDITQRGLSFPVAAGEARRDIKVEMVPTGAISGRVVDEDGQPMGHVLVMALTPQDRAGEVRLEIERVVLTDERGEYRLYWLGPGKYSVAAVYEDPQRRTIETAPTAPPGRTIARQRATSPVVIRQLSAEGGLIEEAYAVVYAGGSTDPRSARMIDVQSAETFAGVDIPMGAGRTRTHHIRGVVINGETGQPAAAVPVLAIPRQWRPNALLLEGVSKSDGTFDLGGAFSDSYVLSATSVPFQQGGNVSERSTPRAGYLVLDAGTDDVSNVRLVMRSGTTLVGHVTVEGRGPSDSDGDLAKIRIGLTRDPDLIAMPQGLLPPPPPPPPSPTSAGTTVRLPGPGQVVANGDFTLYVSPGEFRVNIEGIPPNTYVKSMRMGGEDLLHAGLRLTGASDNPVQITLGADGATITGTALDQTSRPFTNATVALVPDAPNRGHSELYRNATTDSDGNFKLTRIAPGNYKVFAWEWASPDSWENSDFLRSYEGLGKNVQVSAFGKLEKIQLNVIPTKGRR